MVEVTLTLAEVELVRAVGTARQASATMRGRPDYYGFSEEDPTATHINAAGAELAAAIVYGLPWSGVYYRQFPAIKPADIGRSTEVRSRRAANQRGSLIVHPEDPPERSFVLVWGALPEFSVVGSIRGCDAQLDRHWRVDVPHPAFFVRREFLREAA